MNKVLAVLFVLVLCMVGIGFYRGWFAVSNPSPPAGSNDVNVNLTTDPDKMKEDAEAVKDKAGELTEDTKERFSTPADTPNDESQPKQKPPADENPAAVKPQPEQSNGN